VARDAALLDDLLHLLECGSLAAIFTAVSAAAVVVPAPAAGE
jgi:hypothetical protein